MEADFEKPINEKGVLLLLLRNSPYLLLVAAACLWGGNFVAGKILVTQVPPVTLAFLRWSTALIVLLPITGRSFWNHRQSFISKWRPLLLLSVTGVAGFNTLVYISVQYTTSINASLMNAATPILILIISWLILREKIIWLSLTGILLSIVGILWIISRGSLSAILGLSFNPGDLWMLLAILFWAFYSVGMKKTAGGLPANALFFAQVAIAVLALLPATAIEWVVRKPSVHWSPELIAGLLYLGIFASVVAFSSWNRAITLIGPSRCAGFLNLIPLFSAIFATVFTGERIQAYHFIGAALILSGVYIANRILKTSSNNEKLRLSGGSGRT